MTTATAPHIGQTAAPAPSLFASYGERRDFANQLRTLTLACRVRHERLGVRKALTREQIRAAAETFDAEGAALTAAKKLFDTRDPSYRAVVNVRSRAGHYWKSMTTPFPEPGVRLIRKTLVGEFDQKMTGFRQELLAAAAALQAVYADLRQRAQQQLGTLFNPGDYPDRVDTEFDLAWDYPSIEPPAYLKDLHPQLYEQECERIRGRFEEAVRLTEEALASKFREMVSHLVERLKGDVDGKPKMFRDSAMQNLSAFFEDFRNLDLGSNSQLLALVDQAQQAIHGVTPDDLRGSTDTRTAVADQLSAVQQAMDELMIARPKRAIQLEDEQ